jgi:hypothetical protein
LIAFDRPGLGEAGYKTLQRFRTPTAAATPGA